MGIDIQRAKDLDARLLWHEKYFFIVAPPILALSALIISAFVFPETFIPSIILGAATFYYSYSCSPKNLCHVRDPYRKEFESMNEIFRDDIAHPELLVLMDSEEENACTGSDSNGYYIAVHASWFEKYPQYISSIVAHEFAHIERGDAEERNTGQALIEYWHFGATGLLIPAVTSLGYLFAQAYDIPTRIPLLFLYGVVIFLVCFLWKSLRLSYAVVRETSCDVKGCLRVGNAKICDFLSILRDRDGVPTCRRRILEHRIRFLKTLIEK